MDWSKIVDDESIVQTAKSLNENGINAIIVNNGDEAKQKVLEIMPKSAEAFALTSVTLDTLGISEEINNSGNYKSVRNMLNTMTSESQSDEKRRIASTPEWAIGSAHAVTKDGQLIVVSATGSQLPAYSYGAANVIMVIGAQKIVNNLDEGFSRIYDYVLPLESERARKAYGVKGSAVNKILIINKESANRITVILVKEALGF